MELAGEVVTQLVAYLVSHQGQSSPIANPAELALDQKRLAYALINLIDERISTLERRPGVHFGL